jgi:hypothetical protein
VKTDGCCASTIPAVGDVAISLDGPGYQGGLPPCADVNPLDGIDIKLQAERSQIATDADGFSRTVIDAARTDKTPSCGHRIIVTSYREHLVMAAGTAFGVRQSTVVYRSAQDIARTTTVVSNAEGKVMLLSAISATPPSVDTALLPGLGLSVDSAPVCSWAKDVGALLRAHLTTNGADCALNSGTQRCCDLLGTTLEVQLQSALIAPAREPAVLVNLTLRQPGLFVRDP